MIDLAPMQIDCSRPFYDLLSNAVTNNDALFDWVLCPYTITGLGLTGVGAVVTATGFVGLMNWSEGWTLPMTWLALVLPVVAAAMLPGNVLRLLVGISTVAVGMFVIGLYWWFGRS